MTRTTNTSPSPRRRDTRSLLSALSYRRIGAAYVLVVVVIVFCIWIPGTFAQWATVQQILNNNAVSAMFALALLIPLAAGAFDISAAYTMTLSGVVVSDLIVNKGFGVIPAVLAALVVSAAVGLVNGLIVVVGRIDSLIATLGSGSLILAGVTMVTENSSIYGADLAGDFAKIAQSQILPGVTMPVLYLVVLAAALWFVLDLTVVGRRVYATGFNADAARLAGVRTARIRFLSLVVGAVLAGACGIVLASTLGAGSPTAGNPYLLAGFAAAFLGSTQFRSGRFNVIGTLIAIALLATGSTGLALAGSPTWAAPAFTGLVLICALFLTSAQRSVRWHRRGSAAASINGAGKPGGEPRTAASAAPAPIVMPSAAVVDAQPPEGSANGRHFNRESADSTRSEVQTTNLGGQ